jgi:hypothetical protein
MPLSSLWINTMNRCLPTPISRFLMALVAAMFWLALPDGAVAQTIARQFPPAAKRATLEILAPPEVLLNGASMRLSPGARIKGVNNLMVMSAALVGTRVLVNYVLDGQGLVHEVWILSEEEAREKRAGMATVTNFIFGADTSKPK